MAKMTAQTILKEAALLKEAKCKDYQGGLFNEEDYFPFGYESYMTMILTKITRIRSVMERTNTDKVNYESVEDSLVDLINYSAMMAAWVVNKEVEQDGEVNHTRSPYVSFDC